jgi:hypothetical protein
MNTKPTHGGQRPGSGRPKKDYKTVTVSFRVRFEIAEPFKIAAKRTIKRLNAGLSDSSANISSNASDTP